MLQGDNAAVIGCQGYYSGRPAARGSTEPNAYATRDIVRGERRCRRGPIADKAARKAPIKRFRTADLGGAALPSRSIEKDGPQRKRSFREDNAHMIGCQGYYECEGQPVRPAFLERTPYATRDISLG